MLTVKGINNFMDVIPAERGIANVALAKTLTKVNQDDSRDEALMFVAMVFQAPKVQATALYTPRSYCDMLKCDEKQH